MRPGLLVSTRRACALGTAALVAAAMACADPPTSAIVPDAQNPATPGNQVPSAIAMTYDIASATTTAADVISLPLVVRVYAGYQKPAVGITVRFAMRSGSGSVNPTEAVTDAAGEARTTLTYPYDELNVVEAIAVGSSSKTTISVGSYRNHEGSIRPKGDHFLHGTRGQPLSLPLTVRVVGRDGTTPLASRVVRFTVETGGGTVGAPTAVTNEAGEASVSWTLGPTDIVNRVLITGDRLIPLTIHAIGAR